MSGTPPSELSVSSWRPAIRIAVALLTVLSLGVLCLRAIPLGVPGEWTWARRAILEIDPVAIVIAGILASSYWVIAQRLIDRSSGPPQSFAPLGPCLLALVWLGGMLLAFPEFQGIGRSPTVLYYKRTEGYFWQAAFEVQDTRQYLTSYRDSISNGDNPDRYLHLGTHPPGLTLVYRGLLGLLERSPKLARGITALEPRSLRDSFATLREFPTPSGGRLSAAHEATLWAATLLTLLATAVTAWPIYRLTERMSDPATACRAALFWPLVPSLLVFFPKSDLLCPLIATTSCWLWLDGWSKSRWGRCLLAGSGFFVGLMLTLALAPVALLLVIQTVFERSTRRDEFRDRPVKTDLLAVSLAVTGLVVPMVAVSWWGRCNVVAIWTENLKNHALFYDHNTRSFGLWLTVNPLEASLALGAPLACLVGWGLWAALQSRRRNSIAFSQSAAWLIVWGILWLSGKNMGEAARLWIFLAPWPVMTAATAIKADRTSQRIALALQMTACIVTVAVIDGFHFADLIGSGE